MKRVLIVILFFALPTILGGLVTNSGQKEFIYGNVVGFEFLLLGLYIFAKRNNIIDNLKKRNSNYRENIPVFATINESSIEYIRHYSARAKQHQEHRYRDDNGHHELVLNLAYELDGEERSRVIREGIGFIKKNDHTFDKGNQINIYVNPNDYFDISLYSKSAFDSSYNVFKLWIGFISFLMMLGGLYFIWTCFQ